LGLKQGFVGIIGGSDRNIVPGRLSVDSSIVGSKERVETSSMVTQEAWPSGSIEESAGDLNTFGQDDLSTLSEIDETIINLIPSYRGILTKSPLAIFSGGIPYLCFLRRRI
jgi:hypothetical protein